MAKLYFRYGAMNCGKTTSLLQVAHNYEEKGMNVVLIKPEIDKKGNDKVVSRLNIERKVDILLSPNELLSNKYNLDNLDKISCILVDEAQFLKQEQVKELWAITKIYNIPVICYGLKASFQAKLFEGSKALLEYSDELEEMVTICSCGKKAKFNARLINNEYTIEGQEVAIDGIDASYESLCGECYLKKVLKIDKIK